MKIASFNWLDQLSTYARLVLLSPATRVEEPVRAELFGLHRFEEHARSLAEAQPSDVLANRSSRSIGAASSAPNFFPRVDENTRSLRQAYDYLALTSGNALYIAPAAQWLLDNFHLVEAQLLQIREGVPRRYYSDLPKLTSEPLQGLPRVYGIAWAYVAHTDSVLNTSLFSAFLTAYQDVSELTLGELWAMPTTLRVVLLENLRRIAEQIARGKVAREIAHSTWDHAEQISPADLDQLSEAMRERGLESEFLTQLWQRLPAERSRVTPEIAAWVDEHCPDGQTLIAQTQTVQVEANLTVSNIIGTFRLIDQVDWVELLEPVSRSLQTLRALPDFNAESEATRQQITHSMERLARLSGKTERAVAEHVVALATEANLTASYFLIGPGVDELEHELGMHDTKSQISAGDRQGIRIATYAGVIAVATLLVLGFIARHLGYSGRLTGLSWFALVLMAWPVWEAMLSITHRLIAESFKVQSLPRLDFTAGIPDAHRVLVVLPTMLTSTATTTALVHQLHLHWLANPERNAQFALLTDWSDANDPDRDDDIPLLENAKAQIATLNAMVDAKVGHTRGSPPRFLIIHRPRLWSNTQRRWIGWERKRGKLEMLIRLIAGESNDNDFVRGASGSDLAPDIKYVVTLDSDTGLPPGTLRELVSIAAHPLNTPEVDKELGRVVAGYGILQPRVLTPLPQRSERSPFHWMFAGQGGIDTYSAGTSDIYQDVFGVGTYTGKGLLNVAAVHATLDQRLPNDAILSHDLLEGSIARCAHVSDVVLIEDHPHHSGVAGSRIHRWTRGDWQLLPLMMRKSTYGLDALSLWKMTDNLRRSTVIPVCALLLTICAFTGALPFWIPFAATLAALLAGPLMGSFAGLVPTRRGIAMRHFFRQGGKDLVRGVAGSLWQFLQIPASAALQVDAIGRALWRMTISRAQLLEWTTAAQAQAQANYMLSAFIRKNIGIVVVCVVLAIACLAVGAHPIAGALLFLVWAAFPLGAWWSSQPTADQDDMTSDEDREYLGKLAHDTWRFFEKYVNEDENHLPPDNVQMDPEEMIAHRTSPTNIGLYMLAVASAREFGWIDRDQMARRIELTLNTVEGLEKFQGHLYNWYDTVKLEVLNPPYVSTVDSGNLAGLLLTVGQACRAQKLDHLATRCDALFEAMDFRGLYNPRRHLFHIGLRVKEHALDASYYDLLASESRLTSFLAIAKGDVARKHWVALGRPFLSVDGDAGLKSWSGSMFEYLMPALILPEPEGGLLHTASMSAIEEQREFASRPFADSPDVPWGISESAYFAQDHSLAYQYSPYGVPRLALRRTPPAERVIAPYATLMAAMFDPTASAANLRRMEKMGARTPLGMMEAIDFTVARQPQAQEYSLVNTLMSHHQGMGLVSLCNLLCHDAPRKWLGSSPIVQAFESLLHECTPRQIIETADPRPPAASEEDDVAKLFQSRDIRPAQLKPAASGTPQENYWSPTQLLSNGNYTLALQANGAGVARWKKRNVTRWRDDLLRSEYGTFFYVKKVGQRRMTSLTAVPAPNARWIYNTRFLADRVLFEAEGDQLRVAMTAFISPEDDVELRTLVIHNDSYDDVELELASYFEAVLADPRADEAHPSFSNLFIHTSWQSASRALVLTRKPRLAGDPPMAIAHFLAESDPGVLSVECIADRSTFLGRGGSVAAPALQHQNWEGDHEPINGLDPVACLKVRLKVKSGAKVRLSFATAAADDAMLLEGIIDKYLQTMHVDRALRMTATLAQVRLRDLGVAPDETTALQDLTTALLYTTSRVESTNGRDLIDQRLPWRFGISGDRPMVLVRINSNNGLPLVHSMLRAQSWWAFGGMAVDLVVLNGEVNSYLMPLHRDILAMKDGLSQATQFSIPRSDSSGFYLLREEEITHQERLSLTAAARVVMVADGRSLEQQIATLRDTWTIDHSDHAPFPIAQTGWTQQTPPPKGRFHGSSGEFRFEVDSLHRPTRPWVNIIANDSFGFQVSDSGSGYTWAVNSRQHQITPWSNDPIRDPSGEHFWLVDLDTAEIIRLTPTPDSSASVQWRVRHGQGYTIFESTQGSLSVETRLTVDLSDSVKTVQVKLRHDGNARRRLRAIGLAEWQMGASRGDRKSLNTWYDETSCSVFAMQRESRAGFGSATAFLSLRAPNGVSTWTCDRREFFDGVGSMTTPKALGGKSGAGLDACGALSGRFSMESGSMATLAFAIGHAHTPEASQQLAIKWQGADIERAVEIAREFWNDLLGHVQVKTPDPLFDALVNKWLLYQTIVSRLWSKAGFYQAGGAFGYRDQLQDSMALATPDPARLRSQILLNASRQFHEGDVQHWWHAPGGEGVRTHFSDDLLWLPYATAHYLSVTGDRSILDEQVHFLVGPPIPEGAEDAYYGPSRSDDTATLFEHASRTIDRSLKTGEHGLPFMGTGDWNDGMNRVGHEGRGESVWLAWFLCNVVDLFAPIAEQRGEIERANKWRRACEGWIAALHKDGWDGAWFRRAFFDNGAPLGSKSNDEGRIDLIAQAWSVLSNSSNAEFTKPALASMQQELMDDEAGLLKLLAPPFQNSANNPGYIQAYPPGVRENGGQYSHAGVWAVMALAQDGQVDAAWRGWEGLSPAHRTAHPTRGAVYELEPYVIAGDVYGAHPYVGRGGWSWYTGSAAWLYRASIETILGVEIRDAETDHGSFRVNPRTPSHWNQFEVSLRLGRYRATVIWSSQGADESLPELKAGAWMSFDQLPLKGALRLVR